MRVVLADDKPGQRRELHAAMCAAGLTVAEGDLVALEGQTGDEREAALSGRLCPPPDLLVLHFTALGSLDDTLTWLHGLQQGLDRTLILLHSDGAALGAAEKLNDSLPVWKCRYSTCLLPNLAGFLRKACDAAGTDWPRNLEPSALNSGDWQGQGQTHCEAISSALGTLTMYAAGPPEDEAARLKCQALSAFGELLPLLEHLPRTAAAEECREVPALAELREALLNALNGDRQRTAFVSFLETVLRATQAGQQEEAQALVRALETLLFKDVLGL